MASNSSSWFFVIGVVLAVIAGIIKWAVPWTTFPAWLSFILIILGLLVGFFNITGKEAHGFLIAGTIMVLIPYLAGNVFTGLYFVPDILAALLMLFTPAVIITAIKEVWGMAKGK
ncbi:MAG: hypothetical protein V1743_00660 [Nanoarchaeota archaeon]